MLTGILLSCIKDKQTGIDLVVGDRIPDFSVLMDNGTTVSVTILNHLEKLYPCGISTCAPISSIERFTPSVSIILLSSILKVLSQTWNVVPTILLRYCDYR